MHDLLAPVDAAWQPVSRRLAFWRRLVGVPPILVVGAVGAVAAALFAPLAWLFTGAVVTVTLVTAAWVWVWARRNANSWGYADSWGYAENADDLLVTGGVMFRRLVVIPYGRMQYVDVQAGPVQRWCGLATVTLHTASTDTAATIPGLPADEARALRDRLTDMGQTHGAG